MSTIASTKGKGWRKDYPDFRDNTPETNHLSRHQKLRGAKETIQDVLKKAESIRVKKTGKGKAKNKQPVEALLQPAVDLRKWCSPVEDQGMLGSCTAHAGVAMYEYFERRAYGRHIDASRLFLYKATRNLLNWKGDDGAYLRSTMAALALFGLVPEKYFPYIEADYNVEPSAFHYSFAQNYQALLYYRVDRAGISKKDLLLDIKSNLNKGFPLIFGFTCFSSMDHQSVEKSGCIPIPDKHDDVDGGHAVMAVGYDDSLVIVNPNNNKIKTKGAILIRNSWGIRWGDRKSVV